MRPERLLSVPVVDVVVVVAVGRSSAVTPASASVVGIARDSEPSTAVVVVVVVVVATGMLVVQVVVAVVARLTAVVVDVAEVVAIVVLVVQVVVAVAALRSMLGDRESPDESLRGVPVVVVVVAFR